MERVTGIGGIFIKARDPCALREWYRAHLGIDVQPWGGFTFQWHRSNASEPPGATVWNVFPAECTNFARPFMVNYRVSDLRALLQALRDEGCEVEAKVLENEYGRFGWVVDPEGNKVELWEPPLGPLPE
jgi:predicted enzyme related to lactoylglutathione lyase